MHGELGDIRFLDQTVDHLGQARHLAAGLRWREDIVGRRALEMFAAASTSSTRWVRGTSWCRPILVHAASKVMRSSMMCLRHSIMVGSLRRGPPRRYVRANCPKAPSLPDACQTLMISSFVSARPFVRRPTLCARVSLGAR